MRRRIKETPLAGRRAGDAIASGVTPLNIVSTDPEFKRGDENCGRECGGRTACNV
jgi:hypothetical protein